MNVDRIAKRAAEIRLTRVLLTIVASPLYLLGFIVGVLFVAGAWLLAGAAVGFAAGREAVPIGRDE